jgi:hypothetical protein
MKNFGLVDHQPKLLEIYFLILNLIENSPCLIWLPIKHSRGWRSIKLPISRYIVLWLVCRHIKGVIIPLQRKYRQQLAIISKKDREKLKELLERLEELNSGLPTIKGFLVRTIIFILVVVLIYLLCLISLTKQFFTQKYLGFILKTIFYFITQSDKIAELLDEPSVFQKILVWIIILISSLLISGLYFTSHLKFKRVLFSQEKSKLLKQVKSLELDGKIKDIAISDFPRYDHPSGCGANKIEKNLFDLLKLPIIKEFPWDLLLDLTVVILCLCLVFFFSIRVLSTFEFNGFITSVFWLFIILSCAVFGNLIMYFARNIQKFWRTKYLN